MPLTITVVAIVIHLLVAMGLEAVFNLLFGPMHGIILIMYFVLLAGKYLNSLNIYTYEIAKAAKMFQDTMKIAQEKQEVKFKEGEKND